MLTIGSISNGTLRMQDLLPAALFALEGQDPVSSTRINEELITLGFGYSQCGVSFDDDSPLWDEHAETLHEIYEEILVELQQWAPPFTNVGAHEGDGADLGVWPDTDAVAEAVENGEVARVGDPSELENVPAAFSVAVHVNDHGNTTLYQRVDDGADWEIAWAVV